MGVVGNLSICLQVPKEETRPVCSKTDIREKGTQELRTFLKLLVSLCPAEKRPKTEPSATAFSGCSGSDSDDNSCKNLEEKDSIRVELQGSELWKRFHDIGTEMIITKAGRFGFAQAVQRMHTVGAHKMWCLQFYTLYLFLPLHRY